MTLNTPVHKNVLLQILKDVYSDSAIAPFLGFKGGTAAFMFYGLSRFSVDLDFDLLDDSKEDIVFERIEKILKKYGVIKQATRKRFSIFFLLSYQEHAHNIKVEINRRMFGSRFELNFVQNSRNSRRRHATTVAGFTTTSACFRPDQSRESQIQKRRSRRRRRGRGTERW